MIVICCGYFIMSCLIYVIHLPIFCRVVLLAPVESYGCCSASEATLKDTGKKECFIVLLSTTLCRNVMTVRDKWHVDTDFFIAKRYSIDRNYICLMTAHIVMSWHLELNMSTHKIFWTRALVFCNKNKRQQSMNHVHNSWYVLYYFCVH